MDSDKFKKSILIIEDDEEMSKVLIDKFINSGYAVSHSKNGEEGLKLAFEDHPEIILLDIIMPVMDGISMLKKLREDRWGVNVPVVILTNISETEKLAEALEIGIVEYIIKSETALEEVVAKVERIIGAA